MFKRCLDYYLIFTAFFIFNLSQISTSVRHNSFVSKLKIDRAKILGEGGFGIVFEGVWGEIKVAVKRIPVEKAASSKREENALKIFNDEHVIKLFHVEEDQNFKYLQSETVFILAL